MGRANVRVAGLAGHAIPSIAASPHPDTAHRPTATIPALADAVLALDKKVSDPVELYVGDRLIARGELEEVGEDGAGGLAVRLTEVADLKAGL